MKVSLTPSSFTCNCFQRDTSSGDLKELIITLYIRYDFNFRVKGEAYCNSWVVSGYAREVKNGFVTFSFNWKDSRHSYEMVERNTDSEQSLFFLKDSEVTRILWAWRSRETRDARLLSRVFAAPRSQSWAKTRKKAFASRLRVLMLIMKLKCICSNVPKNLLRICPHTPHTKPLTTEPYYFQSAAGQRSHLCGKHSDRYLITVLVDPKIKIPAWYCLEDEAVMLFDSYFTFESKLGWHRLFLTVESTRGIRTLVVVFELLEEMVAWGW